MNRFSIVYYTDPLCCWSWAFESTLRQLREYLKDDCEIRYCMGGMLASWNTYQDTLLMVTRPAQMGPVWMQVRQVTGAKLNERIWHFDPPASSYPACIAVKCMGRQSKNAEEEYLYRLRKAVMLEEKNIAKPEVLLQLAEALDKEAPGLFDLPLFKQQLTDETTINAFKADLNERKERNISRFPSLWISTQEDERKSLLITGNRPFEALQTLIHQF